MIQTGCPKGDGTGGESCWGGSFADECTPSVKFDRPYVLGMANAGAGTDTNGSQFFITVGACAHLNGKHTIFGRVVRGQEVAQAISELPTTPNEVPIGTMPRIISMTVGE